MKNKKTHTLVAALDIGTSKVHVLIASCNPKGMEIIGLGMSPSCGVEKGIVTNIDATVQSIQAAVLEAERTAGTKIQSVYTGIAGNHIHSLNSYGAAAIAHQKVTQKDVDRAIEAAQAVAIPADQKLLHVLPQEFLIDNQSGIREPIEMSGVRLEAKVHIITGSVSAIQNITTCVQRCGLSINDIILEQLASSQAVLSEDEKELGVCLLDIGGGSSDIAVFKKGAIRHTMSIPIAGNQVTRDLAVLFHIPTLQAEHIKYQYTCAVSELAGNELIELPGSGDRPDRKLSRQALSEVVSARYEELFHLVKEILDSYGYLKHLASGLVLTGGGSSIVGSVELAENVFKGISVRRGYPQYQGSMADKLRKGSHVTGVGLLQYGYQHALQDLPTNSVYSIYKRMKSWLQENF